MSLTGSEGLFAAVHQDGINDVVRAYFTSRPRYLNVGSSFFVPSTTVNATRIDAIDIGAGIHFLIELEIPRLDLHPDTFGFALPPNQNQFSLEIKGKITLLCRKERRDDTGKVPGGQTITTELGICSQGHIERTGDFLRFVIDNVEIKDISPDSLESIMECIIGMVLNEALSDLLVPYEAIFIQIGTLNPVGAPTIANDTLRARANFII
ncbi:MAG: hypothetical protein V7661_01360 [Sulfitobacter sp.]